MLRYISHIAMEVRAAWGRLSWIERVLWVAAIPVCLWLWVRPQPAGVASVILGAWAAVMTLLEIRAHRKPLAILVIVALVALELHAIYRDRAQQNAENIQAQERIQREFDVTLKSIEQVLKQTQEVMLNIVGDSYPYVVPYLEGSVIYPRIYNGGKYALNGVSGTIARRRASEPQTVNGNIIMNIGVLSGNSYSTFSQPMSVNNVGNTDNTYTIYLTTITGLLTEVMQLKKPSQDSQWEYRFWIAKGAHAPDDPDAASGDTLIAKHGWVPLTNPPAVSPPSPTPPASLPER